MSADLRDVLDDVAGGETVGLRVDVAAARARTGRLARLRAVPPVVTLLAAAAAVIGVLVPTLLVVSTVRPPAEQPDPPGWTWVPQDQVPLVTDVRMDRAKIMLGLLTASGETGEGMNARPLHSLGRGPELISADGKVRAALPWGPGSSMATLSPDGTRVAWVTLAVRAKRAAVTVHHLRLAEGTVRSQVLPAEAADERPVQLHFDSADGRGLLIATRSPNGASRGQAHLFSWRPGSAVREVCSCLPTALGLDRAGRVWQARPPRLGSPVPGIRTTSVPRIGVPTWAGDGWGGDVESPRLVVGPDGRVVGEIGGSPVDAGDHTVRAWPLSWTGQGVVAVHEQGGFGSRRVNSLIVIDLDAGTSRTLAAGDGRAVPLAVSSAYPGL